MSDFQVFDDDLTADLRKITSIAQEVNALDLEFEERMRTFEDRVAEAGVDIYSVRDRCAAALNKLTAMG